MTALSKDTTERYPNIAEMLADVMLIRDSIRFGKPINLHTHSEKIAEDQEASIKREDAVKKWWVWVVLFILVMIATFSITMLTQNGNAKIKIPDFKGRTIEDAQKLARETGLEIVDDGRGFSDVFPAGTICQQEPGPSEIATGKSNIIKVKISDGSSRAIVPDLKGLSQSDASSKLVSAGLIIGSTRQQYSDTIPEGFVISQKPISNSKVPRDSNVDVVLSKGVNPSSENLENNEVIETTSTDYNVDISVPADSQSPQTVKIIVIDDNGENTFFEEDREPGDKFTVTVPTFGRHPRIQVFVADNKIEDVKY